MYTVRFEFQNHLIKATVIDKNQALTHAKNLEDMPDVTSVTVFEGAQIIYHHEN